LIALNPNGTFQYCPSALERTAPPLTDEIVYPSPGSGDLYGLTDGAGLQAFVLLASRRPLPAFAQWPARTGLIWKATTAEEIWKFDGQDFTSLRYLRRGTERRPVEDAPPPLRRGL
jgi:hypothetical protein